MNPMARLIAGEITHMTGYHFVRKTYERIYPFLR